MMWIGVVCEGDRDYDMIKHVASHFLEEETQWLWLQPNSEFGTQINGNGWKGVLRWCETHKEDLDLYISEITPKIDALIIQIDADVARCEEEIYCKRILCGCAEQGTVDPLNCDLAINGQCPQTLPPNSLCNGTPAELTACLKELIKTYLEDKKDIPVLLVPCDASDTWILAAFEETEDDLEAVPSPWKIITRKKDFHGIRIPGRKKLKSPYLQMIDEVCAKWETVKGKCPQASAFEAELKNQLGIS